MKSKEFLKSLGITDDQYFYTGSTVYGGATIGSDVDICLPVYWKSIVLRELEANKVSHEKGEYFKCEYGYFKDCVMNFIFLSDWEFPCWKLATKLMKEFPVQTDRERRHRLFEMLLLTARLFGGCIPRSSSFPITELI